MLYEANSHSREGQWECHLNHSNSYEQYYHNQHGRRTQPFLLFGWPPVKVKCQTFRVAQLFILSATSTTQARTGDHVPQTGTGDHAPQAGTGDHAPQAILMRSFNHSQQTNPSVQQAGHLQLLATLLAFCKWLKLDAEYSASTNILRHK